MLLIECIILNVLLKHETYIKALQTNQELRILSNAIAEKTASELEEYPSQAESHFRDIKEILIKEGSNFKN